MNTLLTGDEVARRLNISRSYAFTLIRTGEIPSIRLGRLVRVREETLDKFIKEKESDKIEM